MPVGVGHGLFAGPDAAPAESPPRLVGTSGGVAALPRTVGPALDGPTATGGDHGTGRGGRCGPTAWAVVPSGA